MRAKVGVSPWRNAGRHSFAEQARDAEALGFWSIWLPESHFVPDAMPSPLLSLASAAGCTETIRLGTTSLLLPIRNPVLLAEEIATLDQLSSGRLVVGLGRGFRRATFSVLGVDAAQKRSLFEDSLKVILEAWSGKPLPIGCQHENDGTSNMALLFPRPFQVPHPPLWMAAFGPKALRQAARFGMPYLASPIESEDQIRSNYEVLCSVHAELGSVPSKTRPVMRTVFVSEDSETLEKVRLALQKEQRGYLRTAAPVLAKSLQSPLAERVVLGSPAEVEQRLGQLEESIGMTHLVARSLVPGATEADVEKSLDLLSDIA